MKSIILFFTFLCCVSACKKSGSDDAGVTYTKIEYTGATILSEARRLLSAAGAGNKIIFAGGISTGGYSKTIDIYDISSNAWTTTVLSEARGDLAAAAAGNKIVFAGGYKGS